jgi:hypothetical protein
MKSISYISALLFFLVISGCITQFVPETDEDQNLLVVEGLITDKPEVNKIKLSRSMPLGKKTTLKPLKGCTVSITDDQGNTYQLAESSTAGTYLTNQTTFQGSVGRKYTLHVNTNNSTTTHYSYQSLPAEMIAVPAIDSLFYEKVTIKEKTEFSGPKEGCQVYLNTHDSEGNCKYYRWEYIETWKFQLPYSYVPNNTCWITNNSNNITIKNTSVLAENRVTRLPLHFISNETDRLSVRYSILVNQYSINEDEYTYWEKLQNISEEVGSLYDITPSSIPGNIFCIEDPGEQVLGYFSVSAKISERIYIDGNFRGLVALYTECVSDTVFGNATIPNLNSSVWIIDYQPYAMPPYKVLTDKKYCADCTTRGTTTRPDFWNDDK